MAAEFQIIVDRSIQKLNLQKLLEKQSICQSQVESLYKNDEKIRSQLLIECNKDVNNFQQYLQQYRQQQINMMTEICFKEFNDINSLEYKKEKRECLINQQNNNLVFEQNIKKKLNSYL